MRGEHHCLWGSVTLSFHQQALVGGEWGREAPVTPPFHIPLDKGKHLNPVVGCCGMGAPGTRFSMSGSPVLRCDMASAYCVPATWGRRSTSPRFSGVYTKERASTPGNHQPQTEDLSRTPGDGLGRPDTTEHRIQARTRRLRQAHQSGLFLGDICANHPLTPQTSRTSPTLQKPL